MHCRKEISYPVMRFILNLNVPLNVFWKKRVLVTTTEIRMKDIPKIVNLAIKGKKETSGDTEIGHFMKT